MREGGRRRQDGWWKEFNVYLFVFVFVIAFLREFNELMELHY